MIKNKLCIATGILLSVALNTNAQGQESEASANAIEEMVVTSTKRETNLLETALAVTALSQGQLDREGVDNLVDIENLVPNLQIGLSPEDSGVQIAIRGLSSNNFTELGDPTVAIHFDGLYSPRPQGGLALLYDVERIEINRGPQGTLFGRNSTAGSINAISKKPVFGESNGSVSVEVGNFNQRNIKGWLNIPVNDAFAMRASFVVDQADAWLNQRVDRFDLQFDVNQDGDFDDIVDIQQDGIPNVDQRRAREVDDSEAYTAVDRNGFRLGARWTPNDDMDWNLIYEYFQDNSPGGLSLKDCEKAEGTFFACDHAYDDIAVNVPGELDFNIQSIRSTFEWQLTDDIVLEHRISYASQSRFQVNDGSVGDYVSPLDPRYGFPRRAINGEFNFDPLINDANLIQSLGFASTNFENINGVRTAVTLIPTIAPFDDLQFTTESSDYDSVVTELQLKSTHDGDLQWIGGLFYMKESNAINFEVEIPFCCEPGAIAFVQPDRTVESAAVFAQFDYKANEKLNLTAGIRYTYDRKADNGGSIFQAQGFANPNPGSYFPNGTADIPFFQQVGYVFLGQPFPTGFTNSNDLILQSDDITANDGTLNPNFTNGLRRFPPQGNTHSNNWSEVTWKLGADYLINDNWFAYGYVATGFKAGGFGDVVGLCDNCGNVNTFDYDPETNVTYELGIKGSLFDGRLNLLGNIFYSDYDDLQQSSFEIVSFAGDLQPYQPGFDPIPNLSAACPTATNANQMCEIVGRDIGTFLTQNISKASVSGLELEFDWRPWAGGRINGWFAYLNAELGDFPTADGYFCFERALLGLTNCAPEVDVTVQNDDGSTNIVRRRAVNQKGNKLPWSPEYSATINIEHKFYLPNAYVLQPSASISYQDEIFFDNSNFTEGPFHAGQPEQTTGNVALSLWNENDGWGVSFYVNNVTDELIRVFGDQSGQGFVKSNFARPRTFGMRFNYDFSY